MTVLRSSSSLAAAATAPLSTKDIVCNESKWEAAAVVGGVGQTEHSLYLSPCINGFGAISSHSFQLPRKGILTSFSSSSSFGPTLPICCIGPVTPLYTSCSGINSLFT